MAQPAHLTESQGFAGALSGMSLIDILQVKSANRYSGAISVDHQGNVGIIFFKDGEVIHAEQDELRGVDAFNEIIGWKGGGFKSEPKLLTTGHSISHPLTFLILEAMRLKDESHNTRQSVSAVNGTSGMKGENMSDINTKLKTIPGIDYAVIMSKDGQITDDPSGKAEVLGGYGLYLALFAGQISSLFGIGGLKSATVHGNEHHMFLFDSKKHHLCVSADGSAPVNTYESEIRRIMAEK